MAQWAMLDISCHYSIMGDGIEMLGYTFKTAQATPEFLADLQLEINRRLVDYEVEHSLPVPNVVFSVESAQ